jgi:transposase-like protein
MEGGSEQGSGGDPTKKNINNDFNNKSNFFKTVLNEHDYKDTDKLADHLSLYEHKYLKDTDVRLSVERRLVGEYNKELSRIARFVRKDNPNFFFASSPSSTNITIELISNIRNLHQNVPSDFKN